MLGNKNYLAVLIGSLGIAIATIGCGGSGNLPTTSIPGDSTADTSRSGSTIAQPVQLAADANKTDSLSPSTANLHPEVLIQTTLGDIKVRLNMEKALATVDNFLSNYANVGFYSGTIFHYVDPGYMVATGGYTADFVAKPTRTPIRNEAHNGLLNKRGTIGMIRDVDAIHSATSQFYFNLADNPSLDQKNRDIDAEYGYCVFGEVIEGWEVVERIAAVPVATRSNFEKAPVTPILIKGIQRLN